jgi:Caspase domain
LQDGWAIVIGIDDYGGQQPPLQAAVDGAVAFRSWLVDTAKKLDEDSVTLLVGRRPSGGTDVDGGPVPGDTVEGELPASRDNLFKAINELMAKSEGTGESLWFYFSGHGLTAEWANREESALVFPGADTSGPFQTLAVRSLAEFFETTQFKDQFFFIDACRNRIPPLDGEIGAWQIPRRRDPGQDPVQQFILYATSPGRTTKDATWPNEDSAFSGPLLSGLRGEGAAKAWSWERRRYEIRWDRLASYVKATTQFELAVPQDVGTRGVAGGDRDPLLAVRDAATVEPVDLTLDLSSDPPNPVTVTLADALGVAVARANDLSGPHVFPLLPRTYAATTLDRSGRIRRLLAPIELYDDLPSPEIFWQPEDDSLQGDPYAPGMITIEAPDPLAVAEVRDETRPVGVATHEEPCRASAGFYRVRLVAPEREQTSESKLVPLRGGETRPAELAEPPVDPRAEALAATLGGNSANGYVRPSADSSPVAWAQPSTVVATAFGSAIHGDSKALAGLGLDEPLATQPGGSAVAFLAVVGNGDERALANLCVRIWRAGDEVSKPHRCVLRRTDAGVASFVKRVKEPEPYWLSLETGDEEPTVIALPLINGCVATVVAQVDSDRIRLYQYHPPAPAKAVDASKPDALRRREHLQRQLLGGRLDGAESIVAEVRSQAQSDPFGACLAGYVMLRLGMREGLGELASAIVDAARLSDGYILRGEFEAHRQNDEGMRQAFTDAVNAGIPAFGEGLTRLVEGLRASSFVHPRGALVRHIFQRHARGSMWSAFTPRRGLRSGRLVISGADLGFEG